jgi:N4-(beta-N-acetylglucosaminyl)-L-asparaginase
MSFSRRNFITTAVVGSISLAVEGQESQDKSSKTSSPTATLKRPIIIAKSTGYDHLDGAHAFLKNGGDTLDAAIKVVKGVEDDPNIDDVGLGGLPNEDGVVELDASCMHGPSRRAGAVGGVRNIKNVSLVAKAVTEHTGHVMLVGEGAEKFAVAVGFPRENLLTERSRKTWLLWKEYHSSIDWWGPGMGDPHWQPPQDVSQNEMWQERIQKLQQRAAELGIEPEFQLAAVRRVIHPPTGTIHCSALNDKGEISGVTTTSGLAYKLAGRLGDSPIIGAGCYTDQDVGSAGATGNGEENIKIAGAHTIIENMRRGMSPHEAGMDALKRLVHLYDGDMNKVRLMDMTYYILRKDGAYAGVSLWEGYSADDPHKIAVHDGQKRLEKTVAMFKGPSQSFPPFPKVPVDLMKEIQ